MPRPLKCRRVGFVPGTTYFKPAGVPMTSLEEVQLSLEEIEALRLKDVELLEQEEAAQQMNISRATFQRILASARKKAADALLNGKAIRISGGNVEMTFSRFRCRHGHEWDMPNTVAGEIETCPSCQSPGSRADIALPEYGRLHGGWRKGKA